MATNSDEKSKHTDAAMRAKRQSFKKRKDCILKKSMELSVLCGIKVCAVIVDPNGKVQTWPENKDEVLEIVKLYHQNSSDDGSKVGCKKKRGDHDRDYDPDRDHHQVVLDLQQQELDEVDGWIEGLSETSANEFLTEINANVKGVECKIDILERARTTLVDGDDDCQMNDHSNMAGTSVVLCDGEKAMGDHSINDHIPTNFLDTKMIDDQMNDSIIMPDVVIVSDSEEEMEHSIFKDQEQNPINPMHQYVDAEQNFNDWCNKLVSWNNFEEDALTFDSDFWQ